MSITNQDPIITDDIPVQQPHPEPKIPRAAFICGLAALAFTTGLTVACLPALRKRQRAAAGKTGLQFLSNAGLMRVVARPTAMSGRRGQEGRDIVGVGERSGSFAPPPPTPPPTTTTRTLQNAQSTSPHILDDPSPTLSPVHPAEHDVGPEGTTTTGQGGAISPLFALGAFGIATGLVLATAGATAVAISKILDVRDMDEFSAKMREFTGTVVPTMSEKLYSPPPPPAVDRQPVFTFSNTSAAKDDETGMYELDPLRGVDEEDSIVRGWFGEVVREIEDDRRRIFEERQIKGTGTGRGRVV